MACKLIIESGATKSDWCLVEGGGNVLCNMRLPGINVSTMHEEDIIRNVRSAASRLKCDSEISEIHAYMAGLPETDIEKILRDSLGNNITPECSFDLQSDLVAAARAVCGHKAGIAAILGTGSNSCEFDGVKIVAHVNSGGFVLGDEGGAASLGRMFLSDYIKGLVPSDISVEFKGRFDVTYATIVKNVYSSSSPGAYLGSFAPFILSHYDNPYISEMVDHNFRSFIERSLSRYSPDLPVGVTGNFGYACREILSRLLSCQGLKVSTFCPDPMERLVNYHSCWE